MKIVTSNKKAYFNYHILAKYESGIILAGSEIKSIRNNHIDISQAFAQFKNGELYLVNANISIYMHTSSFKPNPLRTRKLLMHKIELTKLKLKLKQEKALLIPLKVYFKNQIIKIELGLTKPKKLHDKRAALKAKTEEKTKRQKIDF